MRHEETVLRVIYDKEVDDGSRSDGSFYTFYLDGTYIHSTWQEHEFQYWALCHKTQRLAFSEEGPITDSNGHFDERERATKLYMLLAAEIALREALGDI